MTGAIVLATEQGLGYLAKAFYENRIIQKVFIQPHSSRQNHPEWFLTKDILRNPAELLECDSIVFFETPFNYWKLIPMARERGVKTVFIPMYECTKNPLYYEPDLVLSPSALDKRYFPNSTQITIPVKEKWKLRTKARVFVHNRGNGGLGGRNGTMEVLDAMKYVKSPIKLILRSQDAIGAISDQRVEIVGRVEKGELWARGDVFLFPEKFNGLSLPIQEAFASGMAVMCGARFPMTEWLPNEMLIPVDHYTKERIAVEFEAAQYDPKTIARCIDEWYDKDITKFSTAGKVWGTEHSWQKLGSQLGILCGANR